MKYENEEQIRKDFARIFDWYKYNNDYGYARQTKELRTPEWAEIFSEVGALIERSKPIISGVPLSTQPSQE